MAPTRHPDFRAQTWSTTGADKGIASPRIDLQHPPRQKLRRVSLATSSAESRGRRSLCCACRARRREPVLFHSSCPPQLSRAGYHPRDPRWAAAARSDSREAPRSLTSAACLARSADRARFRLSPIRTQKPPLSLGCPHHRRCGTGIWPDRDITARRPDVAASCASLPTVPLAPTRTPAENRGFSTWEGEFPRETGSHVTRRWRGQSTANSSLK